MDSEQITVRLPRDLLDALEVFRREEADLPTRPEAIRRLVAEALATRQQGRSEG